MIYAQNKQQLFKSLEKGNLLFCLGIIFLPSALIVGGLFLLIALIISVSKTKRLIFNDKWNYPFFLSTGLLIVSCIKNTITPSLSNIAEWNVSSVWINLFHLIPLFLCFWGFQEFLKNKKQRNLFVCCLLMGNIPVIFSCIAQYWFSWYGPFETLDGMIIWFQKPLPASKAISGLFSNPNYAGFWLSSMFPFSLALFLKKNGSILKSIILFLNALLIFYLAILSNSRNALIAVFSSFPFLIGFKILCFILIILLLILIISIYFMPSTSLGIVSQFNLIPYKLIEKIFFNEFGQIQNFPRVDIYSKTIKFISQKPWLGWGGSTFAYIYLLSKEGTINAQHSHNLSLQLAFDYGLPLSIILTTTIFILFIKVSRKIIPIKKNNESYIDKSLLASSFIAISFHLLDIPYYDARVSILTWTLFASLKCILDEKIETSKKD